MHSSKTWRYRTSYTQSNGIFRIIIRIKILWIAFIHFIICMPEKAMAPHSRTLAWKIPWTEPMQKWWTVTLLPFVCTELSHLSPNSHKALFSSFPAFPFPFGVRLCPGARQHNKTPFCLLLGRLKTSSSCGAAGARAKLPSSPPVKTQKLSDLPSQPQRPKSYMCVTMSQNGSRGVKGNSPMTTCQLGYSWK